MAGQPGFFDIDERLRELSSKGDDLERLKRLDSSKNPPRIAADLIHFACTWRRGFEMERQAGFFDVDERLQRLSDLGDQLEAYAATVDFEIWTPLKTLVESATG